MSIITLEIIIWITISLIIKEESVFPTKMSRVIHVGLKQKSGCFKKVNIHSHTGEKLCFKITLVLPSYCDS